MNQPPWTVWKTITLGTGIKNADGFRKAIKDDGMKVSDWACDVMDQKAFAISLIPVDVDLVRISLATLGFKKGAWHNQILEAAQERGLDLCPAEVGPQLRLQYADQPNGEWVVVAMEMIIGSSSHPYVFLVGCNDSERWLYTKCSFSHDLWYDRARFVFLRPDK